MTRQEAANRLLLAFLEVMRRKAAALERERKEQRELAVCLGSGLVDSRGWLARPAIIVRRVDR